jgi:hypothetical protein
VVKSHAYDIYGRQVRLTMRARNTSDAIRERQAFASWSIELAALIQSISRYSLPAAALPQPVAP